MVKKYGILFYNNRLIGRRMDKVSHIMEVEALRYEFIVLSKGLPFICLRKQITDIIQEIFTTVFTLSQQQSAKTLTKNMELNI